MIKYKYKNWLFRIANSYKEQEYPCWNLWPIIYINAGKEYQAITLSFLTFAIGIAHKK